MFKLLRNDLCWIHQLRWFFCYDFIPFLFTYSLYDPCNSVVHHLSFHFYWLQDLIYSNCKLQILVYSLIYAAFFGEKQYTVMWQVLWLSPSPQQARPYAEASERKLRDVGFFGTSYKSREEIEKFQREWLSKKLPYISTRAFSKIRILGWETGYLASISTTSSPLETKSSYDFKDLHKPKLITNFITIRLHLWK